MKKDKEYSRFIPASRALLFWTLFIGIGAVAGAMTMLIDPSGKAMGMDAMLPYFKVLPFADVLFNDFYFSGAALLVVNGLTNFTAALLIIKKRKAGIVCGGIFGVTLMLWICVQFYIFPFNFMSTAFFVFGFLQAITGLMACIFKTQEDFAKEFAAQKVPTGNGDKKNLVIFFSRMGYVKKIAYEKARLVGADVCEIKSTEHTAHTSGFWWCGRYAMHKWAMPVEQLSADVSEYEHVTICSPIWMSDLSAPVRAACKQIAGKVKSADYVLLHFNSSPFFNAADEMDEILGLKNTPTVSYCCRFGKIKSKRSR